MRLQPATSLATPTAPGKAPREARSTEHILNVHNETKRLLLHEDVQFVP